MSKAAPLVLLLLAVGSATVLATDTNGEAPTCFLMKDHSSGAGANTYSYKEPSKPFPSLTQCYDTNQGSCCVSAHDAYIESVYASAVSYTCLRQFQHLEHYFCLGCNPEQGKWVVGNDYTSTTDGDGNQVWTFDMRICKSFMEILYNPDDDLYSYDKCGLLDGDGVGYLPTSRYVNASQFIDSIKPPYFEHVNWIEVDDRSFAEDVECEVPAAVRCRRRLCGGWWWCLWC
jgi:hypothetical protein